MITPTKSPAAEATDEIIRLMKGEEDRYEGLVESSSAKAAMIIPQLVYSINGIDKLMLELAVLDKLVVSKLPGAIKAELSKLKGALVHHCNEGSKLDLDKIRAEEVLIKGNFTRFLKLLKEFKAVEKL